MRKQLILVVDDEPPIVRLVRARLLADDYAVITAAHGEQALDLLVRERPDLIVLDVMMPGMDGFETVRRIRAQSQTPVVMLTARTTDADKLKGFSAGLDDYVSKPFNTDELVARIAAVLRRSRGLTSTNDATVLRYANVEIDLERRRVMVAGTETRLSRTEWALLDLLATNSGRVMQHGELLSRIWGPEFRDEANYLRTWVSRLRRKLKTDSESCAFITTFPGIGYRLEPPGSPSCD